MDPEIGGLEATPTITISPKLPTLKKPELPTKKSQRLLAAEDEGVSTGWGADDDELSIDEDLNPKKETLIGNIGGLNKPTTTTTTNKDIRNDNLIPKSDPKDTIGFEGWGEEDLDLENDFKSIGVKPKLEPVLTANSNPISTPNSTLTVNSNPPLPIQKKPSNEGEVQRPATASVELRSGNVGGRKGQQQQKQKREKHKVEKATTFSFDD